MNRTIASLRSLSRRIAATGMSWVFVLLLLAANVFHMIKIRELRLHIAAHEAEHRVTSLTTRPALKLDTLVSPFVATDSSGRTVTVDLRQNNMPSIIYVFTPQCVWCKRNMDNFKAIASRAKDRYKLIGLSLSDDGVDAYVAAHRFDFPVYHHLDPSMRGAYGLGTTPQTIVVSADGRTLKNWVGAYTGAREKEIESFFQVSLPGLISTSE